MADPVPNLTETLEFLDALPDLAAETIVIIPPGGRLSARTYPPGSGGEIRADLDAVQGRSNCYFHVNELRPNLKNRKAKKSDVLAVRMLHVDIDDPAGLEKLQNFTIPPTVTTFSGGGYQAFWFLDRPMDEIARAERLNARVAQRLGGDNCHNVDRLMRLPGTLNVPDAGKRAKGRTTALAYIIRELTDFGRTYQFEDLERALNASGGIILYPIGNLEPAPPIAVEELPGHVSDATKALIRFGDDAAHPIGKPDATYRSRSEVVFRVACDLARVGCDEQTIVGVLTNPVNGISASITEKRHPQAYALRQAKRAHQTVGEEWPQVGRSGPLARFPNALVALTRLGLHFEYDAFANRLRVDGLPVQDLVGELTDDVCASIRVEVLNRWRFDPGKENVRDAAHALCLDNIIHPVREYLDGLRWDGRPRLAQWLNSYLGAEDTPLHRAIGELVLVAAVRRVRQPGVKFDSILILEGAQGSGKSTAIAILAGDSHFSDQEILTLDPKSQMEALEGIWLFELGELQGLSKVETDRVKAFASRRVDRGRAAYARFREDRPRQTIFVGTTNDEQYLKDPTGNRRFWPVKTGWIDLEGLRQDRDQLWAEAAYLETQGRPLTLAEELWPAAGDAQDARLLDDPWLDALVSLRGVVAGDVERVATSAALSHVGVEAERQDQWRAKRLKPLMNRLGWRGPTSHRINGQVLRGYERPVAARARGQEAEGPAF